MEARPRKVFFTPQFLEWLRSVRERDYKSAAKVKVRLGRVEESGNLGDKKYLDSRVNEFIFRGRYGYLRVYYAEIEERILALYRRHKDTQKRDTEQAEEFLANYEQSEG